MLRSLKELEEYRVAATDGDVGRVVNFLFDDQRWAIRHLVVATGGFFSERKVLISPISFREVDWAAHLFHLALTKDNIRNVRSLTPTGPFPVSASRSTTNIIAIRTTGATWACGVRATTRACWRRRRVMRGPNTPTGTRGTPTCEASRTSAGTIFRGATTRSASSKTSSSTTKRGKCGTSWSTPATGGGAIGVLVAPRWASDVSWTQRKVFLNLSREAIKSSPSWDPTSVVRREYEARVHDYYGLRGYWGETIKDAPSHVHTGDQSR